MKQSRVKTLSEKETFELQKRKLELMKMQLELQEGLPHLYGYKWYVWAREFFESRNKENFLCAANQISKSSTQIRKCIDWATDKSKWNELWPSLMPGQKPNQFWYFYPTGDVAQTEFETKWEPQFLPRGKYKDDPIYGWKDVYDKGLIKKLEFNSGVTIYFKTYSQKVRDLQSGTVYSIFCFAAGTKIHTESGEKNIEDVVFGESVLSHKGFRPVVGLGNRISRTRKIVFARSEIEVTDEHPFFTKRGWVEAKDLLPGDECFKTPTCLKLLLQMWYYLRGYFTEGSLSQKTIEKETIGSEQTESRSTCLYGAHTIREKSGKKTSFITRILTHLITRLKIWFVCREPNTQESTKSMSGSLKKNIRVYVSYVKKILFLDRLRKVFLGFVRLSVEGLLIAYRLCVFDVVFCSLLGKIAVRDSVVRNVQTQDDTWVYSLTVEDAHTYFANDFLTHNCDEELPVEFVPELQARLNSSDGYFHMVFTATLGQLYWSQTMEPASRTEERYPQAWKRQVSVYDCQFYEDGSPSHWTLPKIHRAEAKCPTEAEKQRRIFGRFVKSEGLMFPSFDYEKNTAAYHPPPRHWHHFSGVDPGTGGSAHPAAIVFVAVSPDYKHGRVWRAWRGDGISTASPDIYLKYKELRGGLSMTAQKYDWASREFFLHVSSKGEAFSPAQKDHASGYSMLNTLFKSGMLKIYTEDSELEKLISEIRTLSSTGDKRRAQDDLCDALRYAVMEIPWDFSDMDVDNESKIDQFKEIKGEKQKTSSDLRREWFMGNKKDAEESIEDELDFWNEAQEP